MEEDPNVMRHSRGQGLEYTRASKSYALSGKIMLSAIIILFSAVMLILFLHIYARCCLVRRSRRSRRGSRLSLHPNAAAPSAPRGLDSAVLRSLPVFVFSSKTHQDSLECAVCLSEFEDGEKGRLLPKCNHRFHIDCIDMWFHSHSACPLCRSDVKPDSPKPNPAPGLENLGEISVGAVRNGDLEASCSSSEQTESSSSSGSGSSSSSTCSSSEVCSSSTFRKKDLGCVGMAVEVPTRRGVEEVEIAVVSPSGLGLKSPGSRILALKRILSRDRKVVTETADLERGEEQPNQNCS
eukprot:TRINITY_DN1701_c0_g1_i1.p1 TRINITY_DN1701_c0_g1~~TRINITY_DN1701_c0_g1_i1.p1  ORF type:complete len:295 (-),score=38.90 TRINITY_DN1701_c0_g1_i1:412-1296(-)